MIFSPVVIANQRLSAEGKSDKDQYGDHIDFHDDSHSCNTVISVRQQRAIRKSYAETLHQVGDGSRNTNGKDLNQFVFADVESGRLDRKSFAAVQQKPDKENIRTDISNDCSNRRTGSAESKNRDKDRIQNDIDDRSENRTDHGSFGKSFGTKQV